MSDKILDVNIRQLRWLIILSYFFGLMFDTMLLLNKATLFIPPVTLFLTLFWCAQFTNRTHILSAFVLGLLADTLYQTTLGSHALLFVVITFMMIRHRLRFRAYPVWQQAFFISGYMMVYQLLNFIFFSPVLSSQEMVTYWVMPAAAILLWPVVSTILRVTMQKLVSP
ncbi:rod shape-determining protein MreD [Thiomicrorhabdus aquaedulcis]|uniref:rod shape-determining protein MreD n=1 Tax=Thiomicrorhabdus aquaedulcis TaxID=2211106 RepID=UPI000FD7881D|nr:rod shape-determining protein MreD [Thiomicrorhabdus aquaedulcis]